MSWNKVAINYISKLLSCQTEFFICQEFLTLFARMCVKVESLCGTFSLSLCYFNFLVVSVCVFFFVQVAMSWQLLKWVLLIVYFIIVEFSTESSGHGNIDRCEKQNFFYFISFNTHLILVISFMLQVRFTASNCD